LQFLQLNDSQRANACQADWQRPQLKRACHSSISPQRKKLPSWRKAYDRGKDDPVAPDKFPERVP
jgi:hypothetical protein